MIEDFEDNIRGLLVSVEDGLKLLEICKPSEKQTHISNLKDKIKEVESELDLFNSEIQILDYSEQKGYKIIHDTLDNDLKRLKNEFEMKKMAGSHLEEELKNMGSMSQAEMQKKALAHGNKLLDARKERANNILFTLNQANMLVNDINDEIKEQNQRMMDMEEIIKDSQSALNRVNELVGFFAKAFYRDMILKCLIILIAIAIVAIAIASVAKKKAAIPQVTPQGTNNSTTPVTPTVKRMLIQRTDIWENLDQYLGSHNGTKPPWKERPVAVAA